jgi:hypothetical protein
MVKKKKKRAIMHREKNAAAVSSIPGGSIFSAGILQVMVTVATLGVLVGIMLGVLLSIIVLRALFCSAMDCLWTDWHYSIRHPAEELCSDYLCSDQFQLAAFCLW